MALSGGFSLQEDFARIGCLPEEPSYDKCYNMELYFEEEDFDGFMTKLARRDDIRYVGDGVKEAGWGQLAVRFYDLDGHMIEVGESMKMELS